jgi:hypothetical protein
VVLFIVSIIFKLLKNLLVLYFLIVVPRKMVLRHRFLLMKRLVNMILVGVMFGAFVVIKSDFLFHFDNALDYYI